MFRWNENVYKQIVHGSITVVLLCVHLGVWLQSSPVFLTES